MSCHRRCNFSRSVWSCTIGLTKLVLYLSLILLFSATILNCAFIYNDSKANGVLTTLPIPKLQFKLYGINTNVFILCLICMHGLLFENRASLKVFSILTVSNCLLVLLILTTSHIPSENAKFLERLDSLSKHYDWFDGQNEYDFDYEQEEATQTWDKLQNHGCCGIFSYNDWAMHRPDNIEADLYPRSCCEKLNTSNVGTNEPIKASVPVDAITPTTIYNNHTVYYCRSNYNGFYSNSCWNSIYDEEVMIILGISFMLGFQLMLAVLASCIGHHVDSNIDNQFGNRDQNLNMVLDFKPPMEGNVWQTQMLGGILVKQNNQLSDKLAPAPAQSLSEAQNSYPKMTFPPRYGSVE